MPTNAKDTRTRARSSSKKRDALEPYRDRARSILNLYFNLRTPAFIRDLISSWMTALENDYQVHYANSRAVADAFLPLALQAADAAGEDVEDPDNDLCAGAFFEAAQMRDLHTRREPSERERLEADLRREADAFATLINSKHLPDDTRIRIGELYDEIADAANNDPDTIRAKYPAAMLKLPVAQEGGE